MGTSGETFKKEDSIMLDSKGNQPAAAGAIARDPICGMDVETKKAAGKSVYQGQTYYFCAPGCKTKFDKNPAQHMKEPENDAQGGCGCSCHEL